MKIYGSQHYGYVQNTNKSLEMIGGKICTLQFYKLQNNKPL